MPTVSIIIPTYGHRDFVTATLQSVWSQSFIDYEVIVVNDGSPDDTGDLLRPFAESERIHYIEQANAGQSAARNRGIAAARGEFIALLDDDDLWPPDKLEWQAALLRAEPNAALVYGYLQTFGQSAVGIHPGPDAPTGQSHPAFLARNYIGSPGQTLMRAEALRQVGGFDPAIWGADDWDLYIRLAASGPFVYRHQLALNYRKHSQNASRDIWRMYVNACRVQDKHFGRPPSPTMSSLWRECRRFILDHHTAAAVDTARECGLRSDWSGARRAWLQGLRINPFLLKNRSICVQMLHSFSLKGKRAYHHVP